MLSLPVLESFNTYDNPCSWRRVRCQTFSWVLSTPRHCNHQPLTLFVTHSFMFSTHNWILQNLSRFKQWYSSQWNEFLRIFKLINLLWKKLLLAWSPFSTDTWSAYRTVVCLSPWVKSPRSDELALLHVCKYSDVCVARLFDCLDIWLANGLLFTRGCFLLNFIFHEN